MYANQSEVIDLARNLDNWFPLNQIPEIHSHFTKSQIRYQFLNRHRKSGLDLCFKQMGKRGYCNPQLLALYMAGLLPNQQD